MEGRVGLERCEHTSKPNDCIDTLTSIFGVFRYPEYGHGLFCGLVIKIFFLQPFTNRFIKRTLVTCLVWYDIKGTSDIELEKIRAGAMKLDLKEPLFSVCQRK